MILSVVDQLFNKLDCVLESHALGAPNALIVETGKHGANLWINKLDPLNRGMARGFRHRVGWIENSDALNGIDGEKNT